MTDKKLIPFNLERALAGDPVVTRDGRNAKVVYKSDREESYPLLVVFEDEEECTAYVEWHTNEGINCVGLESVLDLFMAPKTKTYKVDVYKNVDTCDLSLSSIYLPAYTLKPLYPFKLLKTISFELEDE